MLKAARHTLSYQLAEVIESRGLTAYGVGQLAGVDPGVVKRWLSGERDIRMTTADRIGTALGLRLVEVARRKASTPRPNRDDLDRGKGSTALRGDDDGSYVHQETAD